MTTNGLPVIAAPATATVKQGKGTAIAGVSLSESGDTAGETFTAVLSDTNGLLSAKGKGITGSGTTTLTVTGSLTQVNGDLATLKDTDSVAANDTINLTASDGFGNVAAPASIAVTVTPSGAALVIPPAAASPHTFVAAMAGFGAGAAGPIHTLAEPWRAATAMLTGPRVHIA